MIQNFIYCILLLSNVVVVVVVAAADQQRNFSLVSIRNSSDNTELSELERQNRITEQIFANFLERRLFPYRRPRQKVPTINDILPKQLVVVSPRRNTQKSTRRTRQNSRYRNGRNSSNSQTGSDLDIPDHDTKEIIEKFPSNDNPDEFDDKDSDSEALQSVESNVHDHYYQDEFGGGDPSENEVENDCPNCVDESQHYLNKWTMPLLKLGEKRYYLGVFFKANWFKAAQYCRYHGMHLASIGSQEESDKLEKHIRDFGFGHEHFWTSGTDLADEGRFFWMANGRPMTYTNWNAGEPNNFRYENGEEENCLELWNRDGKGLKWNDSPCSFETYFVCEI